jgi:transcriptional regulator with XRE-family HTH domain
MKSETESGSLRRQVGRILKKLREEKGYSQQELAARMGISRSTISKIENGQFNLSVDYLEKFSYHLGFEMTLSV